MSNKPPRNQRQNLTRIATGERQTLALLARPTGFEPVTLGLEMQGIEYTNDLVLRRFVILQYLFYNVFTKMA